MRKVRRSQTVSPFGVGAIVDLLGESFVVEDASRWEGRSTLVPFPRLEAYLGVPQLRTPRPGGRLPYYRFPEWLFCPSCRRMTNWSPGKERDKKSRQPRCQKCRSHPGLVPMRFVAACDAGHLTDVDWKRWAHHGAAKPEQRSCRDWNSLRFISRSDAGGGLASLIVRCDACGAANSLEKITDRKALRQRGQRCSGRQPWQQREKAVSCDEDLVAVQRGASNLYYPDVISAIDIPPDSDWASVSSPAALLRRTDIFQSLLRHADTPKRSLLVEIAADESGLSPEQVEAVLNAELTGAEAPTHTRQGSPRDITPDEWVALCNPRKEEEHDYRDRFVSRRTPFPAEEGHGQLEGAARCLAELITDVVLVDRLREVRVLQRFHRLKMAKPIPANLDPKPKFLPAVEVFGEGFFIRFDEEALSEWEGDPQVRARSDRLAGRRTDAPHLKWLEEPTPRYVLLHTFAHLLLRQTAFEAGYSTSALRERLYVTRSDGGPAMAGILIYTAAGDSEGTLGGLARLGQADRLVPLIGAALASAQWCSFDPVCGEATAQGPGGLSLAACHACTLVSETSCVAGNRLLDRRLVVDDTFGFFRNTLAALDEAPGGGTW